MLDARLSVVTCDKCGQVMQENQGILIIGEGIVKEAEPELDFQGTGIRYACHLDCWDNIEDDPWDKGVVSWSPRFGQVVKSGFCS